MQSCNGNHGENKYGHPLYCMWCEEIFELKNKIKALESSLKALQPTECLHPWDDIKQGFDRELKCEYVKCLKCKVVIERGFSSDE